VAALYAFSEFMGDSMKKLTKRFWEDYSKLYDSGEKYQANVLLLLVELANEKGEVPLEGGIDELQVLFDIRFEDGEEDSRLIRQN